MGKEQRRIYDELETELCSSLNDELDDSDNPTLVVNHVLQQLLRLAQVTSGIFSYLVPTADEDKPKRIVRQISDVNPKVEMILEIIKDTERDPKDKIIIWAHWVEDIENLVKTLTSQRIEHACYYGETSEKEREQAVHDFNNNPNMKIFIANAMTAGEGLNLLGYDPNSSVPQDTYCGTMIFLSQDWSMIRRMQAEDRAHRRGTRHQLRIIDLTVVGTIDEEIRQRVQAKKESALDILDVKQILKNIKLKDR